MSLYNPTSLRHKPVLESQNLKNKANDSIFFCARREPRHEIC